MRKRKIQGMKRYESYGSTKNKRAKGQRMGNNY